MPDSKLDKISEIIPQFYFDLIARVTPGAVVLFLYGMNFYINNDINFPDLGKTVIFLILLLCSYVIGLVLDVTVGIFSWALSGLAYLIINAANNNSTNKKFIWWNDNIIWLEINALQDKARASVLTKMMAEKILFRTLLIVSLWTFIISPKWLLPEQSHQSLIMRSVITTIFVLCFFRFEIAVRHRLKAAKQKDT